MSAFLRGAVQLRTAASRALVRVASSRTGLVASGTSVPSRALASSAFTTTDGFLRRHVGPRPADVEKMLKTLGCSSLQDLINKAIPTQIRLSEDVALPQPAGEQEALAELRSIAKQNKVLKSFIGMGYHGTYTPSVVLRNVVENPGWYTSYTPYQPEISQGRLEMLLNYQTMIANLTGLEFSNASLLDEATAAAEAMHLCFSASKGKRNTFFVAADTHLQTIDLIKTRAEPVGCEVVVGDAATLSTADLSHLCGALVQYSTTFGDILDLASISPALKAAKVPLVVATDPLACALLEPPGSFGADIAIGCVVRVRVVRRVDLGGGRSGGFGGSGQWEFWSLGRSDRAQLRRGVQQLQ
jgi:glycine dehydrogenase